jgi:hypothetical protein
MAKESGAGKTVRIHDLPASKGPDAKGGGIFSILGNAYNHAFQTIGEGLSQMARKG